jgi:hypothetical protein
MPVGDGIEVVVLDGVPVGPALGVALGLRLEDAVGAALGLRLGCTVGVGAEEEAGDDVPRVTKGELGAC